MESKYDKNQSYPTIITNQQSFALLHSTVSAEQLSNAKVKVEVLLNTSKKI